MNKESVVRRFRCLLPLLLILSAQGLLTNIAYGQGEYISNPTSYSPLGNTTHISGSLADIQSDDADYLVLGSYFNPLDVIRPVGNDQSDVDSSSDAGTHGNFSAQQHGPDLVYDTLSETNVTGSYELDLEVQWTNLDFDEENEELAIYADKRSNTGSLNVSGGYMIVGDGITEDWGSSAGTISFWVKWNVIGNRPWGQHGDMEARFSGSNLVLDWSFSDALTSNTSFTSGVWYFIAIVWNENTDELLLYVGDQENAPVLDAYNGMWMSAVSTVGVTENNFMASRGGVNPTVGLGEELRYWTIARNQTALQRDYDAALTGSEPNLASYFELNGNFDDIGFGGIGGSGSGSHSFSSDVPFDGAPAEKIRVDVWDNGSWQTLLPDLDVGWTNVSVASYLDSATFTIRFKGELETADMDQDVWRVDSTLLHLWADVHRVEVEFAGRNNETLSQLTWTFVSAWTTDMVDVSIRLYNHSSQSFATAGSGFVRYASSPLPEEDETKNQTIITPTGFSNATGHWRIMIRGAKDDSPFELKVNQVICLVSHGAPPPVFDWKPAVFSALLLLGVLLPLTVRLKRRGRSDSQVSTPEAPVGSFAASHQQIMRGKTLLIMDSTPGFYNALVDFVRKSIANGEALSIFTSRNSLLHTAFSGGSVRFYLLSPKISSLKTSSRRETLVPMRDLSVLLDVISRIWRKGIRKPRTIIFDNLSDTILMCGFKKTYKFMRFLLEAKSSPRAKALFIFNPSAHDSAVASSVRGLFQFQSADFGTKTES